MYTIVLCFLWKIIFMQDKLVLQTIVTLQNIKFFMNVVKYEILKCCAIATKMRSLDYLSTKQLLLKEFVCKL